MTEEELKEIEQNNFAFKFWKEKIQDNYVDGPGPVIEALIVEIRRLQNERNMWRDGFDAITSCWGECCDKWTLQHKCTCFCHPAEEALKVRV